MKKVVITFLLVVGILTLSLQHVDSVDSVICSILSGYSHCHSLTCYTSNYSIYACDWDPQDQSDLRCICPNGCDPVETGVPCNDVQSYWTYCNGYTGR
ncbi:12639_t:CDS:2 [Dentiscutata erythropus]|uniref:12639_t:CDS:1 n=1 Tax=Dentiscutata erythropus TaxID=1348616 RepID=A0A9N8ZJY8_9GLOM|nr:12639_t:CDS:2 [Dentiscutata erythropus]